MPKSALRWLPILLSPGSQLPMFQTLRSQSAARLGLAMALLVGSPAQAVRNTGRTELARLELASAPETPNLEAWRALRLRCLEVMRREKLFVPGDPGGRATDSLLWDAEDQSVEGWATPCAALANGGLAMVGGRGRAESDQVRLVVVDHRDKLVMQSTLAKGPYGFFERPAVLTLTDGDLLLLVGNAAPKGGRDDGAPLIQRLDRTGKVRWSLKLPDQHPDGKLRDRGFVREGNMLRVLGVIARECMDNNKQWIRNWPWTGWVDLQTGKLVRDTLGVRPQQP